MSCPDCGVLTRGGGGWGRERSDRRGRERGRRVNICDRPREKGPFVVARINGEIDKIHEISVISRFFKHITGG